MLDQDVMHQLVAVLLAISAILPSERNIIFLGIKCSIDNIARTSTVATSATAVAPTRPVDLVIVAGITDGIATLQRRQT